MIHACASAASATGAATGLSSTSTTAATRNGTTCRAVKTVQLTPRFRSDSALARGRHGTAASSGRPARARARPPPIPSPPMPRLRTGLARAPGGRGGFGLWLGLIVLAAAGLRFWYVRTLAPGTPDLSDGPWFRDVSDHLVHGHGFTLEMSH